MKKKQTVTAVDIAMACGVSQATVSYVINEKPGKKISAKTRALVLETAAQLGYVPSATARSMRTNQAMSIGIVSGRNNINIGFNHALRGIKAALDRDGYTITLLNGDEGEPEENEYLRYYFSGRIDGILFLFFDVPDSTTQLLAQRQIPYLMVSENGVWGEGMEPQRAFDQAILQCAQYCREKNFRSIRFISLKYGDTLYSYKYNLLASALKEVFPEACLERVIMQAQDLTNEDILIRLENYLASNSFELAVTGNQRMGWLMQSSILKADFSLPQQVKHISLSSSHVFHLVYPTVTSVDIPLTEIGEYAAVQLVRLLRGEAIETQEFQCTLKLGLSTE